MTAIATVKPSRQAAVAAPDPLVRAFHVQCALGICEGALFKYIRTGRLPAPTILGPAKAKLWRLSELRACNPSLADSVEILLKLPRIAAV